MEDDDGGDEHAAAASEQRRVQEDTDISNADDDAFPDDLHRPEGYYMFGYSGAGLRFWDGEEWRNNFLELNASDFRNKDAIHTILGAATKQQSLFFRGKIILVDEVDGVSGTKDRGGITELLSVIKDTSFPMILTANDPFDKKFSSLRQKVNMVQLNTVAYTSIAKVLKNIAEKEKIETEDDALTSIARRAGGDLRAAINDLQLIAMEKGKVSRADVDELSEREQTDTIHNALMKIFKTTDPLVAIDAFDSVKEDLDKCLLWVDENLPREYEKPADLARAYDFVSKADIMQRRIRRWQHWRFLVYINAYLTAGIAVSKDEKAWNYLLNNGCVITRAGISISILDHCCPVNFHSKTI